MNAGTGPTNKVVPTPMGSQPGSSATMGITREFTTWQILTMTAETGPTKLIKPIFLGILQSSCVKTKK